MRVRDGEHPVTRGVSDFQIHDEVYKGLWFAVDNHILLSTDHTDSDALIGWARRYGRARVCAIQLGHDAKAYASPEYRQLVVNAIRWAAGDVE